MKKSVSAFGFIASNGRLLRSIAVVALLFTGAELHAKTCLCTAVYFDVPRNSTVFFDGACRNDAVQFEDTQCDSDHLPAQVGLYGPGAYEACAKIASSTDLRWDGSFPGGTTNCREKNSTDDRSHKIYHFVQP